MTVIKYERIHVYMNTRLRKPAPDAVKARPFTVYLPEDLDRWLRDQAHEDGRTLTAQTVRVLRAGRAALTSESIKVA